MVSLFKLSNIYGGTFKIYEGRSQDVIKKKIALFAQIKNLIPIFPEGINKTAQNSIVKFTENNNDIFEISSLPNKFQKPVVPMNKGYRAPLGFEKKWDKIHETIKELVELEAYVSYKPYIELFNKLLSFFQTASRNEDVLFLEELNKKARLLFGDNGTTVAELYYRLATRFRHYLIDEFQDTSLLQWRNLYMMVEEALASGGSLFYVGDKKQAIYRFRGGESQLFDEVKESFKQFHIREEHLLKNWRSQKAIVEFNNRIFKSENLNRFFEAAGITDELSGKESLIAEIVNVFKDSAQEYRKDYNCGYVSVERIDSKNQDERNNVIKGKVLSLLGDLKVRFKYEDIAILTRDNSEVELITSWLLEKDIPVSSEKTLNILKNSYIKEIIALLHFLNSPIDDLSFAAFILGDIFSAVSGIEHNQIRDFIFSTNRKDDSTLRQSLYNLFRRKYTKAWNEHIDIFFKTVGFVSPYELLISIYKHYDLINRANENQAFFMRLLEVVKEQEDEYAGLDSFLTYLKQAQPDDLYVKVAISNSIKVLTIHKAKGLEFGVVIIPFLCMDITPQTAGKRMTAYVTKDSTDKPQLVRITKYYRPYSDKLQEIYSAAYKDACIDELNTIYVAFTRPKYELYIFIPNKSGNANNKARFVIPCDINESGSKEIYKKKISPESQIIDISAPRYQNWIEFLKNEICSISGLKNRSSILEGNILHAMLSLILNLEGSNVESVIERASLNVGRMHPFIEDISFYKSKLKKLINTKDMRKFFFIKDATVICEKEVVDNFGDVKRIDRLVIKKDEIYVLDYKSSHKETKIHEQQMREYINIIKDIYSGYEVNGYLVYLDKFTLKEVSE